MRTEHTISYKQLKNRPSNGGRPLFYLGNAVTFNENVRVIEYIQKNALQEKSGKWRMPNLRRLLKL